MSICQTDPDGGSFKGCLLVKGEQKGEGNKYIRIFFAELRFSIIKLIWQMKEEYLARWTNSSYATTQIGIG